MKWKLFSLALATILTVIVGCGGPTYGDLGGDVSFDGQPLKEGVIRFVPVDGQGTTAATMIENGKFREKIIVGSYKVEISSPKLPKGVNSAKEMKRGTVDEGAALEELLPEKYNLKTELKVDVKSGTNDVKFDLKSK